MVFVNRCALTMCLSALCFILIAAQGPGPGTITKKRSANSLDPSSTTAAQMQSRAVDTKVQLEIMEGQPRGTIVGSIPVKPGFTYRFNEAPKEFSLNGTTGELRTTVILDRETLKNDRFDLVVLSSQPTYPIEVRVLVLDVNDNAPEFPEPSIAVTFSENAAPGTKLLLDTATDRDIGPNKVTDDYRIVSGNVDDKFRLEVIRNPSGDTSYLYLRTTGNLDRETTASYQLNVSARDGGVPTHYGYLRVNVTVLDVNDNPPVFASSDYSVSLNESSPVGTKVLTVTAVDEDKGDNARIGYYLAETERRFSVDPNTGSIFIAEHLDCRHQNCPQLQQPKQHGKSCPKSCVFTVYARDHGSPQQEGRTYVTVNLLDANDHDPVIKFSYFPSTASFATVDENAINGSVVAAVSVVDPDDGLNGETTVSIKAGNELHHFRMESGHSFDLIRVNGVLDRERINKYNLTVVATDKGTPARTVTTFLIIYVNDVNDHEPVFEKSEYTTVVNELAPIGTYVAGITATDQDSGVNALIYYSIVSGNDYRWFGIDVDTGLVTTRSPLDREKSGTIELKISARDGGPNPKWAYTQLKVTILDENDQAPQFAQTIVNVSLSEDVPENSLVVTMTAVDHDQGTNGSVIYSLHADTVAKYPSTFAVNALSGQVSTLKKLDRETIPSYQIKMVAKDQGSPPQSATATVFLTLLDVNDNIPIFYPIWYFVRVNDQIAPGNFIARVTATDADLNDRITYRIENDGGESASAASSCFYVSESTGIVHLKSPLSGRRENSFRLVISATDKDGRKSVENAVVEIAKNSTSPDEEINFENDNYIFHINEDDGLRDTFTERELGKVKIKTIPSLPIRFFIVSGDANKIFEIGEHSGVLRTRGKVDREQQAAYSLMVVAKIGTSAAKTRINITVQDLNDNKPQFASEKDHVQVYENAAVGQEIFLVRAKDKDYGSNGRITYSMVSKFEQFRIAADTGVVYLNKPLKVPPGSVLNAEIKATDSGTPALWAKHSISVTVLDVNDHTPVFQKSAYEISLRESVTVNERFIPIVATDDDSHENSMLAYSITNGNQENKFGIFPDGYVYVRQKLDREERDYYCLTISVKDAGTPERSASVPLIVHVIDENDNKPEFVNSSFVFQIKENEMPDTFVGKVNAVDRDAGRNAELTYALAGKQEDFVIDPKNGFVRTARTFDREHLVQTTGQNFLTLEATVTDNGVPRLQDRVKINVYVTDVNDNAPQFLRQPYKVSLSESSPVGTQVVRVFTTDADEGVNRDVFYQIADGNDEKRFTVDKATGQVILAKLLDRETTARYELTVTAFDAGANVLSANTSVTIDITDENDNAPTFSMNAEESRISILESAPVNSKLYQFTAVDADTGLNSEIFFSIGSGNRRESFQIDPLTGVLYLSRKLDYEDVTSYTLNITAYDGGNPRLSSTILFTVTVLDCNDNPPAFPSTAIVRQIRENIPVNTPIVTVTAEDPDSGPNGKIVYSIVKQEPSANASTLHFQINPKTGVIHTQLPIDRESVDTFRLTVRAIDQAPLESERLFAEKMVTVIVEDVNDNAPVFVSMNAVVLKTTTADTFVTNVQAKDADSGSNGMVTYDVIGGNTDLFAVQRATGTLTLRRHLSEIKAKYQVAVKATDEAVQSDRRSNDQLVTIITPGKRELIFNDELGGHVYENEVAGVSIVTVSARHTANAEYDIEYYITNVTGLGEYPEDRIFDIDAKSGTISTAVILDREAGFEWYEVEVYALAADSVLPISGITKIRIDVLDKNDSPPSFSDMPTELLISEDLPVGHVVTKVKTVDPDAPTRITYSLFGDDVNKFNLDPDTGVLSLTEVLDRETKPKHKLYIRASDGIQKAETLLTVIVTDTNDNAPLFSEYVYSFDVLENEARGTQVGQVSASDADENVNGQVSYTVISDWANDVFSLNPQTGIFTLTSKLDYEEVQHYILTVQAQDYGRPTLSTTVTVYFNVIDLNDNQPVFDSPSYTTELLENVTMGTSVLTVSAQDLDSDENGRVEYELVVEDNKERDFEIDPRNGTIFSSRPLDRETRSSYNLLVVAKDGASFPQPRLSASVQVTITIKDVNDVSPEFLIPSESAVLENTAINTVVTVVKAVDIDEGRNGYLEYSLPDSANGMFTIGSADGLLRVNGRLDRETKTNYTLKVRAKDRGEPARQTEATLTIRILDENDNSPTFNPSRYSAFIPENASIGVTVLQVFANDEDEGINGRIRYSIVDGDENRDFSISDDGGTIRVAKNLNYERRQNYTLTVRAEDSEGNPDYVIRADTATVSIAVTDVNDNFPVFVDSPYLCYVLENSVPYPNGYVVTVKAVDADSPPFNSQVRYFLKEGDLDLFRINASTGEIYLLKPLDREKQAEHVLSVVAMDAGSPPLTGSGTVNIFVQDVNDHSPRFERTDYVAFVSENSPSGTEVVRIQAFDDDFGLNAKLRYSLLGDRVDRFQVNSETGLISTRVPLDREDVSVYRLTLVAQDSSVIEPRASTVNVVINVLDENDNAPVFAETQYMVYIPDRTQTGEFVFGVIATDADRDESSRIEYSMTGNDASKFSLNSKTGVIRAARELRQDSDGDRDAYKLVVQASDHGNPPKKSSTQITIKLQPAHLFPVLTVPKETAFVLPENAAPGKSIAKLRASSPKSGSAGNLKFSIAGGNLGEAFKVDANTGEVVVADGELDYELLTQYELWVEAQDSDVIPLRSAVQLVINVTDVNDNAPVFDNLTYTAAVMEEEYPPLKVLKVRARDSDSGANGRVNYRLKNDANEAFTVNARTGEIFTNVKLDREKVDGYQLSVEAYDEGVPSLRTEALVFVTVLDKNDNPPKFTRLFSVNVTENAEPGAFVIQITSSDLDVLENANASFSFVENPGNKFTIDPTSGNVTVIGTLDREIEDEYLLKVAAVDSSWRAETPLTITIQDENDNAPEFESSEYTFYVPETNRNSVYIGTILAQDRDKQGPNSLITYSLSHSSDYFSIDPATAEIVSKKRLSYKHSTLDASPENQYSFVVVATDNGKPPLSSECYVTVNVINANNNAPTFERKEYFSPVPESANPGQQIVQVKATDNLDYGINAVIEYAKVEGNDSDVFDVDRSRGWITLKHSLRNTKLLATYTLTIRAVDHGIPPKHDLTTVTLVVCGVNNYVPIFSAISYQVIVPENEPIGSTILTIVATDEDEGPNGVVRYSMQNADADAKFRINPLTGAITILKQLDYDRVNEYRLTITATDMAFEPRSALATLTVLLTDINDNPPVFNSSTFDVSVSEKTMAHSAVAQIIATDSDSPKFAVIRYAIVGGSGRELFKVDPKNGVLYSLTKFDYEERDQYTLQLLATNPDSPLQSVVTVNVHVRGENEFYPMFVQPVFHFDIPESATVGTYVGTVQATDEDAGEDGLIYYLFVGSSNDKGFAVNAETGVITVSKQLDRETQNRVVLTVMAKNKGSIRGNDTDEAQVCLCRPGYRGNQCEIIADPCRQNPCANGGVCVSLKPGYKCNCPEGQHGRHCEKSTFGFGDLSYMTFPTLDANTNDISVTFATLKSDSLLVYNYGAQTGGRSDFIALELVNGKAVFSYGGTRTPITSITVPTTTTTTTTTQNSAATGSLADGNWHKITATRNGRVVSLSVSLCTENGDSCQECKPGDVSCYTDDTGPSGTLNFNNNPMYLAGVASSDAILERPGQIRTDDFVGCMHSVAVNGRHLNLSAALKSYGVEPFCNRSSYSLCRGGSGGGAGSYGNSVLLEEAAGSSICGSGGTCYNQWKRVSCVCDQTGTVAPNCNAALEPVTIYGEGYVEFHLSEKHRRLQLLDHIYGGSTLWHTRFGDRSRRQQRKYESQSNAQSSKYVSFAFRTISSDGTLLFMATDTDYTAVEMINGQIIYRSKLGNGVPVVMLIDSNEIPSNGLWHTLKLQVVQRTLRIYIDNEKAGEELDADSVHNFLDPYLTAITLGGFKKEYSSFTELTSKTFSGCIRNFSVNGEIQPFGGGGSVFSDVLLEGKVSTGCTERVVSGAVTNPDPLRIGVSLVVVFFMMLLIVIVASFLLFRLRRQQKEKPPVGHMKQNGDAGLVTNGGVLTGAGDVIRVGLHGDSAVPPYMTENGDIIRGVTGHHMVAPEIISKRYKDQELAAMEHMQRSQRPDIIEREVMGKSPPPREEHHSMPQPNHHSQHAHDSGQSRSHTDNDLPEHYDLENSSSIAPSDIDIICHYKSYRDGGNMRKYKLSPHHLPHPATLYHKHNMQHRHSPLHETGFGVHSRSSSHSVHLPPPVSSRVESPKQLNLQHQSTPLARLSPSSELSQQMPRILTLQDISGKPLQSALLATTSSSGGMGKDALHTNSERSLNSPVMSQLSGRSSSESRKTAGPPSHDNSADSNVGLSMGLVSSKDMGRLNVGHPRQSTLVSTLDVVSCSSDRGDNGLANAVHHHLHHNGSNVADDAGSSTSTEESGNDSFTCSEIEYDNNSCSGEKLTDAMLNNLADDDRIRAAVAERSASGKPAPLPPFLNFDSSFRGSLSTLVASDDDMARVPTFRPQNGNSPSSLGWEHVLSWGPNFENFANVFKDIGELPETVSSRMNGSLRSRDTNKSSEEYV